MCIYIYICIIIRIYKYDQSRDQRLAELGFFASSSRENQHFHRHSRICALSQAPTT